MLQVSYKNSLTPKLDTPSEMEKLDFDVAFNFKSKIVGIRIIVRD